MTTTVTARFQIGGHTASAWFGGNPILLDREFAAESDTGKLKLGDGSTSWNALAYQQFWSSFARIEGAVADNAALVSALAAKAGVTRSIATTAPLAGGGDLSGDRIISITPASGSAAGSMSSTNFAKLAGIAAGATANTGTVTSVSIVSANGVSGSIATSTTTPAMTLTLGAITPSSVAASGAVTASQVGIGTTGGAGALNAYQSNATWEVARFRNAGSGAGANAVFVNGAGNDWDIGVRSDDAFAIRKSSGGTSALIFDTSLNMILGTASALGGHRIYKNVSQGTLIAEVDAGVDYSALFYAVSGGGYNGADAAIKVGKNTVTGRSIAAAGLISASGSDFAEYMRKAMAYLLVHILAGQVCGVNDDGELTLKWSEAHSTVFKSTAAGLVGGDSWASHLGPPPLPPRPLQPEPMKPDHPGRRPALAKTIERAAWQAASDAHPERLSAWKEDRNAWRLDRGAYRSAMSRYTADLAIYKDALEQARQIVDLIAFSGQAPLIVTGPWKPGQYVIGAEGPDDTIIAIAVDTDCPEEQYRRRLGKIWAAREVADPEWRKADHPEGAIEPLVPLAWIDVQHG
ncbi:hypothetical protein BH09PSE4_BH09PSE4_18960 [soil metagenome]